MLPQQSLWKHINKMDNNQIPNQMGETQAENTSPIMNMSNEPEKKSSVGSIIATVVIIAIIILGGLYFWGKRIETERANQALLQNTGSTTEETAAAIEATKIETVSQDDSVNTISSELKTTQTNNLSPELQ